MARVSRPCAFLDRDGTINKRPPEHEYVTSAAQFEWLPGAVESLVRLARAGYALAVASNQRGVARGLVDEAVLAAVEERIQERLRPYGCRVEAFAYCMHDHDANCSCRKPRPGLILDLAARLDADLGRSWMIGDSVTDVVAGRAAGCRTALVGNGAAGTSADLVAGSLVEASRLITAGADRPPAPRTLVRARGRC